MAWQHVILPPGTEPLQPTPGRRDSGRPRAPRGTGSGPLISDGEEAVFPQSICLAQRFATHPKAYSKKLKMLRKQRTTPGLGWKSQTLMLVSRWHAGSDVLQRLQPPVRTELRQGNHVGLAHDCFSVESRGVKCPRPKPVIPLHSGLLEPKSLYVRIPMNIHGSAGISLPSQTFAPRRGPHDQPRYWLPRGHGSPCPGRQKTGRCSGPASFGRRGISR